MTSRQTLGRCVAHAQRSWILAVAFAVTGACVGVVAQAAPMPAADSLDYRHDLAFALQKSDAPRDWALGSQLLETRPPSGAFLTKRLAFLRRAALAAPDDRLVQSLMANIAVDGSCKPRMRCGDPAALARLEPGNGMAWLPVAVAAARAGNARATDAALARMVASGRYNEHLGEAIAAWSALFERHPPAALGGRKDASDAAHLLELIHSEAMATALPPAQALVGACSKTRHPHAGTRRFDDCGRVGRQLMNRAQTLAGRMLGVALLRASRAGGKDDIERIRTVAWQGEQMAKIEAALDHDAVARLNYLNMIQSSASPMMVVQYELTINGVAATPPADWKQTVDGHPVEPLEDGDTP
ncbi:MAG: hypothetical protein JSR26_01765 [Proteobacteria bacterium]|nr:hypothetical protein [Pseudomonadota bacterium]